jgi:ribosome-binding factor A
MSSIKIGRINAELVRTISEILANETRDELMHTITITAADCANDLSYAKIYFTSMSSLEPKRLEKEMEEASDFIRKNVAEKMDLRQTPKLKFIFDESIAYGNKIEKIIQAIHEKEN